MNIKPLQHPHKVKTLIIAAFQALKPRQDLDLENYECTAVGKWLEFKVTLRGDHSFFMYFGLSRKVLNHCRRMCSTGRRFVQGVTIGVKESVEEIGRRIANCILAVRTAFSYGNRRVVHRRSELSRSVLQDMAAPEKPIMRTGMSFAWVA
jgi:hypothetical protein